MVIGGLGVALTLLVIPSFSPIVQDLGAPRARSLTGRSERPRAP